MVHDEHPAEHILASPADVAIATAPEALSDGLTLAEAMWHYAADQRVGRLWYTHFLFWKSGAPRSEESIARMSEHWRAIEPDLRAKLSSGQAYLTGFKEGEDHHRQPDKEWCEIATLDPLDDSAEAAGLRLQGVRVFLGGLPAVRSAVAPPKQKGKTGHVSPTTEAAMRALAAVLYGENRNHLPRKAADLSQLAAERAQELALRGCDDLHPDRGPLLPMARNAIEAMDKVDREAVSPKPSKTIRNRQDIESDRD